MKLAASALLLACALAAPGLPLAQTHVSAGATVVQAERLSNGLRQGMPIEDVRKLLGNPMRTATRSEGSNTTEATRQTLQWTYTWADTTGNGTLRVEFGSKVPDAWKVTSWAWTAH